MSKEKAEKVQKPIYKKWWFWVIIAIIVIGIIGSLGGDSDENAKTAATVAIDFVQLNSDLHEDLIIGAESADYPFVQDYYVGLSDDGKTINITAVVDDATAPEKALDFADTLVRRTNLNAQLQDSSIESPTKDTYGGLYDRYNALVGVARASDTNNSKAWLVYDGITSSGGPRLNLQNE